MALSEDLRKKLGKIDEPSRMIEMKYKGYDLLIETNDEGKAIRLFIGEKTEQGRIKGERYSRTLKKDKEGKIFKDHWELKGKAT